MSPMKVAVAMLVSSTIFIICCDDISETAVDMDNCHFQFTLDNIVKLPVEGIGEAVDGVVGGVD